MPRVMSVIVLRTLEDPYSGREVIDSSRSFQRSSEDRGRRDEIVCESVVQISLKLENILNLIEFFLISILRHLCVSN